MTKIINIEYIINLLILLFFHMHMFQLNSYNYNKHMNWMKVNYKKIIIQIVLILIPFIFINLNKDALKYLASIILGISILYNYPKKKSKISFKITNRVKRIFITEIVLFAILFNIENVEKFVLIKLFVVNLLSIIISLIANIINSPLENLIKKRYIKQAKKIIKDMPNLIVIGVTGSYGKTSVKNFLVKVLSTKYEVLVTPKNYNTPMGVAKTIRENLKPIHQIFVCEMGASKIGDIKEICDIVNPKLGIITAIGPQHLVSFKSIDNIIKTKFELLDYIKKNNGTAFLNYDNGIIRTANKPKLNMVTYGLEDNSLDFNAYDIYSAPDGLRFKMEDSSKEIEFKTKLIGKHNIVNLTGVIAVAHYLGIPKDKLITCIRELKSVEHRLEVSCHGNLTIIDDSYNSNPVSSKLAIDTLSKFEGKKIIVTPGLIELGEDEDKYNFEFGEYMVNVCDYIFLVGTTNSKMIIKGIRSKQFNEDRLFIVNAPNEALEKIAKLKIEGKVNVLLENDLPDNYNL